MSDISVLDQEAQRLRVSWKKAHNYYLSFTQQFLEVKKRFDKGEDFGVDKWGKPWTFSHWVIAKIGLTDAHVYKRMELFGNQLADEDRDQLKAEQEQIAAEKRANKEKLAAEKRAELAEKRVVAEHKKREQDRIRQEKRAEKEAEKAERDRQKRSELEAAAAHRESIRRQTDAIRAEDERRKKAEEALKRAEDKARKQTERKKVKKEQLEQEGPENPELRQLLADCVSIEATSRIEHGRKYTAMKRIVDAKQAGKNAQGHWWTWGSWCGTYIKRSRADIWKCIDEYVASCNNSQDENVVSFPQAAGQKTQ